MATPKREDEAIPHDEAQIIQHASHGSTKVPRRGSHPALEAVHLPHSIVGVSWVLQKVKLSNRESSREHPVGISSIQVLTRRGSRVKAHIELDEGCKHQQTRLSVSV